MLPKKNQHRIPQVYLREWSFKDHNQADTLCVLKKGDPVAHPRNIRSFTAETNLFDTDVHEPGSERHFDELCKYSENNYPSVLTALRKNTYDGQIRIYLSEFVSNLFVRQRNTFDFLSSLIEKEHLRNKVLTELAILEPDTHVNIVKAVYEEVAIDTKHTLENRVSAIILQAWKHFNKVLQQFEHVILQAPPNRLWYTSDNPVMILHEGKDGWILGPDAELYFALSKEYLVYMHATGRGNRSLTTLPKDVPIEITIELFEQIALETIIPNSQHDFAILSEDVCGYNVETEEYQDQKYKPVDPKNAHVQRRRISLMDIPTPPHLDDPNFEKLLLMLDAEIDPIMIPVESHPDAVENECIVIVDRMVSERGGRRILGWQIWEGPYLMEAEFHAVWETPDGSLKDVSKKRHPLRQIVFVEDERLRYIGRQVNSVRLNLSKLALVDDFIRVCNFEFRLLNKGKRALLYGKALNEYLTEIQLKNIHKVQTHKSLIWELLDSGGNENSPCPCKQGRKYKNCHGNNIINRLKTLD